MKKVEYPGVMPYFQPVDRVEIANKVGEILESGALTQGKYLEEFEQACAVMAGTKHALGVNSGGTALELVLVALKLSGGEVILPTNTFVASANSIVRAGGKPVFADIRAEDLSLSIKSVELKVTDKTKGVMLVHLFGLMSPKLAEIQEFCKKKNLWLIEDAAHAHGASFGNKKAGSLGLAGCFSYYATKNITTGEGGMITTDNDELAATVRSLRNHGRSSSGSDFTMAGNNFRLAEIPSLLGVVQHRRLDEIIAHRRKIAGIYREILSGASNVEIIDPDPRAGHVYWRYVVLLDEGLDKLKIQEEMAQQHGVRITWMYEPLCHKQPYYINGSYGGFSVAEDIGARLINLPTHMGIDVEAAQMISQSFVKVIERQKERVL